MVIRRHPPEDRPEPEASESPVLQITAESLSSHSNSIYCASEDTGIKMNPTLVEHPPSHPPSFEICGGSDLKYPANDRTYSNLSTFPVANEYTYPTAKRASGLSNPSLGSTFSIDATPHPLVPDGSFHSSPQALLSPPDSVNGTSAGSLQHPLTSFTHSTLPKPYLSNASSDHFNGIPGGVFSSSWSGLPMTTFDRHKFPTLPSTSPYSANGISNPYFTRSMDPRYQTSGHAVGQNYVNPTGTMRTPTSPYRTSYYPHDTSYSDGVSMSQSESSESKGPGFGDTVPLAELVSRSGSHMKPDIIASIHKGFFQVDNKWTCYRRNYFQVSCAFTFKSHQDSQVFLRQNDQHKQVYGYAVSISAKTGPSGSTEGEARGLVQHTPKRSKTSETIPTRHAVVPQTPHHLHPHQHHSHAYQHPSGAMDPYYTHGHAYGFGSRALGFDNAAQTPPTYTFERIQFQKATANNGKRRAQQQFFHVVVELSVNLSPSSHRDEWVIVATKESEPMVVRGRSPGHYKVSHHRRDSQGHMDHDRATGGAGDRSQLSFNPYGSAPVGSYESSHSGHHGGYSGNSYQQSYLSRASPPSAGSGTTLNGSPEDGGFTISDNETLRSTDMYSQQLTPPSETEDEAMFSVGRKRPHEDDTADETSVYRFSPTLCDSMSAHTMDYPTFSQSKALVASS